MKNAIEKCMERGEMAARNKNGFIKLHRRLMDWEWYSDPQTLVLWITLLLMAEWVNGGSPAPGQIITTQKELAELTGLTRQQIRTALKHLESTNEITTASTKDGTKAATLITIEKWTSFQAYTPEPTTGAANAKSGDSTFLPLYKKNKEIKEIKKGQTAPVEAVPMPPEMKAKLDTMFSWRKDN